VLLLMQFVTKKREACERCVILDRTDVIIKLLSAS
jgi:hypothetical protein